MKTILGLMIVILGASIFLRAPSVVILGEGAVFVLLLMVLIYHMFHERTWIWKPTGNTARTPCPVCRGKDAPLRGLPGYKGPLQANGHRRDCPRLRRK